MFKQTSLTMLATLAFACGGEFDPAATETNPEAESEASVVTSTWRPLQVIESSHPYADGLLQVVRVVASPGATKLKFVFDRVELENGYDYLHLSNDIGAFIYSFTGNVTGQEQIVDSKSALFQVYSDAYVNGWGWKVTVYELVTQSCECPAVYGALAESVSTQQ